MLVDYIRSIVDDVFIFSHYLRINKAIIEDCILTGKKINNPLRIDKKPSATFKIKNNKVVMIDYAKPEYGGDIFAVVGVILNLNCNKAKDFIIICETIIKDVIDNKKVLKKYTPTKINKSFISKYIEEDNEKFTTITVEYIKWNNVNFKYWFDHIRPNKELGELLLKELQAHNIYPIEKYWLNTNIRASKIIKPDEPIYAYLLDTINGNRYYKLYMPNSKNKFVTNSKSRINYLNYANHNKYCIIVKSAKDMIFLKIFARYNNITDLEVITISSESVNLSTEEYKTIKKRFEFIFTLYDWDKTGVLNAYKQFVQYQIKAIFITKYDFNPMKELKVLELENFNNSIQYGVNYPLTISTFIYFIQEHTIDTFNSDKDFSDYILNHNIEESNNLFKYIYSTIVAKSIDMIPENELQNEQK